MHKTPSSTSSAKDESKITLKEIVEGLAAIAFIAISVIAIIVTITHWSWR